MALSPRNRFSLPRNLCPLGRYMWPRNTHLIGRPGADRSAGRLIARLASIGDGHHPAIRAAGWPAATHRRRPLHAYRQLEMFAAAEISAAVTLRHRPDCPSGPPTLFSETDTRPFTPPGHIYTAGGLVGALKPHAIGKFSVVSISSIRFYILVAAINAF